jgi:hypothetical protein
MMAGKGDELAWYKGIPAVAVMCTCIVGWDWWERLLIHGKVSYSWLSADNVLSRFLVENI